MYNTAYKRSHGPDHVKELSRMIDVHHDAFLAAESLDLKAEALRLLRGYAAEFLYQVSHGCKFQLTETERVLSQSVSSIADFDPREASNAFENVAKYAHNLLEQPWRKEFRRIKLTSGYWFHNIKAHLQNAHEMLIVLGYVGTDDNTLELTRPADPLVLRALSRDCFLASQECLILSQIWERVQCEIPDYPLTVFEAYETRKKLMGDTQTIITKLVYEARERQHKAREELELQQRYARLHQLEAEQKFSRRAQNHVEAKRAQHGFVPVDRLIDVDDNMKTETTREIATRVLKNTEKQNEANYRKLYSVTLGSDDRGNSSSSASVVSMSSDNSLKELGDVYYDSLHGKSSKTEDQRSDNSLSIHELLEKHKNNVTKVDSVTAARQRKSESAAIRSMSKPDQFGRLYSTSPPRTSFHRSSYSNGGHFNAGEVRNRINGSESEEEPYSFLQDASASFTPKSSYFDAVQPKTYEVAGTSQMTSSSSFKSLKHHQDLPKATVGTSQQPTTNGTSSSGFLSKMSGFIGMGSKSEKTEKSTPSSAAEKEPRKSLALSKSKEPVENELRFESDVLDTGCYANHILPQASSVTLEQLYLDESDRYQDQSRNRTLSPLAQYEKDNLNSEYVKQERDKDIGFSKPTSKPEVKAKVEPWDCIHCTFRNELHPNICEICSKTKDVIIDPPVSTVGPDYSPTKEKLNASGEWTEVKSKKTSKGQGQSQATVPVRSYPSSYYPTRLTMENETEVKGKLNGYSSSSRKPNPSHALVECSQCTLLNPANNEVCECCNKRFSFPEYSGTLT